MTPGLHAARVSAMAILVIPSSYHEQMTAGEPSSGASDSGRRDVVVSISIRTLLLAAGGVALAWALASIGSALLMILVSVFSVAVLSPVATAMERRLRWSRAVCSTVLVLGIVIVIAVVVLVLVQAISDAVRGFSDALPQILDDVRRSELGDFVNGGSGSLDTLRDHATDITKGVGTVSGGVADVGVSAFGAVTLVFSVIFLTLFGLIDEPRVRDWIGGLMYRDKRSASWMSRIASSTRRRATCSATWRSRWSAGPCTASPR